MTLSIALSAEIVAGQNEEIAKAVKTNRKRLRDYIRQWIQDHDDIEDLLQDVFESLTESYRLMQPIEQVASWLLRVARNKVIDRYRKKKPEASPLTPLQRREEEDGDVRDVVPDANVKSDASFDNDLVWSTMEEALSELPVEQREVFIWNELEGKSFKDISAMTGASVNTLLSRKRYAVLHLRKRLQNLYDELYL